MRRAAFTLLEMLVVVAMIAVVVFVLVSSSSDLTPWAKVTSAAREVATSMRFASSEAAATGRTHWLVYDIENGRHTVILPRSEEDVRFERDLPEGVGFAGIVVGDVRLTGNRIRLEFGPLGFAPPHAVHLRYRDEDDLAWTVSLNPVTAEPELLEGFANPNYVSEMPR